MSNANDSKVTVVQAPHRAIFTTYLGPTDTKGSRIIARIAGSGKRFIISWDYALNPGDNHDAAAIEACKRMGWSGKLRGASISGGGYVYVLE